MVVFSEETIILATFFLLELYNDRDLRLDLSLLMTK